ATSVCVTQGFGLGTTAPSGWVFTGISGTYTVASNYGVASPSLSFDTTNDVITTEVLSAGNAASQLSFWIKGQGINSGSTSTFVIDGFDGTSWTNIDIINSTALIASSGSAVIKTYNSGSTPALAPGFLRFRFTYKKGVGNLAFDDVSISCVSASQSIPTVIGSSEIATVGGAFSTFVNATNFPTIFAIVSGTLPTGLNFNTITGQISGAPTLLGAFNIDITATNAAGTSAIGTITITVSAYLPGCYFVNFEDGTTKSFYAGDNIILNGKLWNLSETLTGGTGTTSDYGLGNLCLRMQSNANASATLIQDKSYGIGTVTFNYKKYLTGTYTNQTFGVEYSKDGGNSWINIGFVSPSTTTSQTFSTTINQSGPIRFRILFVSGTENNSVRLNVDNLNICDFVSDPKEIEVYGNATTINNNSIIVSENNSTNFSPAFFVGVDAPIVKTFIIFNFGTGILNLSNLSISSSTNFTITSGLSSTVLTTGQSATFSVTFTALSVGLKTATVTILNDDANEGMYNFLISAKALNYSKCTLLSPTIITQQDFDSNVAYTYTANVLNSLAAVGAGTNYGANRTTPVNMFIGSNSFQSKSNLNTIIFASQNTQNYQNIELSLNIGAFGANATVGMNTADYIQVSISIDGGIKFYPQLRISGNNNSIFDINNTLPTNIAKYKTNATVATIFGCTNNSTNTVSGSYKIINLPNVADLRVQITFLSSLASKI
ncbi:MAG: choice-of-anchor D domain-containing protein, partial [Flavobacterium sp.]|nr:choice-of-anchor D domain-containing protein [Flavobacterium sp.]